MILSLVLSRSSSKAVSSQPLNLVLLVEFSVTRSTKKTTSSLGRLAPAHDSLKVTWRVAIIIADVVIFVVG